jgi:hypothetical protein
MASDRDFTETTWSSPSKKNREEPSKQALQALEMAEDAALEFDEKFTVRCTEREQTVPRFNGAELEIGSKPLRKRGYYTEYELKAVAILELVGEGDFATAENEPRTRLAKRCSDGHYAVKYIQEGLIDSDIGGTAAADAIFETKILMNLAPHPNICQIYGINGGGIDTFLASGQNRFFIITDCLSETLVDRLDLWREGKGYTDSEDTDEATIGGSRWNQRLEIALDIAAALVYLHDRMLVYNVRPDKVGFDTRYGQIKLSNFSQVRQDGMENHASSITKSDDIKTLAYTAPEVLCKAAATISSDVYGFGIMLWEMLSLQRPFEGYDRSMHFEEVIQLNFRPALDLKWPKAIRDIVGSCWHPHRRPTIKVTHESIEESLLFRDSEEELKQVFRTIKQNSPGGHNFANEPSSPTKSPPKTKGSLSAPKTPSKGKTPTTPKTPKRSLSKQGMPGLPESPAEQGSGGSVAPKTPKTRKSGAPNTAESKSPKTPRSKALNRTASSDGIPDYGQGSGRQGRSLTKVSPSAMRSRSVSITREDDTNKEVPSLFAKLDSESIHESLGGIEDEVSMFSKLNAEFGDGSDGTVPTSNSSNNSAGSAGSNGVGSKPSSGFEKWGLTSRKVDEGKSYPPTTPKAKAQPLPAVRKLSTSKISMTPKFGALLSQTTHRVFPKEAMSPKADSLSQTSHEVFSFGVFDDDPTSFFEKKATPARATSFNGYANSVKPFLAKDEVASLFSVESAVDGQSSKKRRNVSSVPNVFSVSDDSFAKWDALSSATQNKQAIATASEPASKPLTEELPDVSGKCNSRESRSISRDDEPTTKMKRSMSMGRRNASNLRRSKSIGRKASSGMSSEEDDDSPSTEESPKSKQVSASSTSQESRPSSRDGDQASKMKRSKSVGRRMPAEDDEGSPSAGASPKSKQVSASPSSREGRSLSRDGDDQASKMRRSKSLGRRKPTGDEDSPSAGDSPKSKQVSRASSSRETRPSSRDGDQASKMRRSKSVGRRMSVEDDADNPSAGEIPKRKQVSASSSSRESRPSSRDGDDQASKMRRSKSLGRRKPTGDEDSPSAGDSPKSKQVSASSSSRESRPSSRDGDQAGKMRRSRSVGRRMSVEDDATAESPKSKQVPASPSSRESRPSSRDGDDQVSKMRRSRSVGRRMSVEDDATAESPKSKQVPASPSSRESRPSSRDGDQVSKLRRSKSLGRKKSTGDEDNPSAGESPKSTSRESRTSSRDDDQSSKMRRSKSTGRRMSSDDDGGAHTEEPSRSRVSRTSSREDDQPSKMRRSKSTGRRMSSDDEGVVPAGEESKPSESKPSRESRSSSRDDPSAPMKQSKSTARSKSKGPSQKSKEDPSGPKTSGRGGTRTVIRMSSKELMEAGYDLANMPKSAGKSKGGRILVPGLDAKDMTGRVLGRRKGKKKPKDESKEAPNEEPVEEPFAANDFTPQAPEIES